jgi:hypothetical protein
VPEVKVDLPKEKRTRSIMWSTPDNHFCPSNPAQMQLFGPRDAGLGRASEIRSA